MKSLSTWILIADSGRARMLEAHGRGKGYREIEGTARDGHLAATHDLMTDRQGRSFESGGGATRHPLEPRHDPRQMMKDHFLGEIAKDLDQRLAAGEFHRLIVVAPPHALGVLRQCYSHKLAAAIVGEVAKDLTKTPDHELPQHLDEHIPL